MYGGKLQVDLQFDKRDLPGRESDRDREDAKNWRHYSAALIMLYYRLFIL